jgi:alpha-beta hydrolase superfamily lysophospholipase
MNIEFDEGVVRRSGDQPSLYVASTMPKDGIRAVVCIVHGYADHGGRYAHVMGALAEHGIGAVAIDLRGHGRAEGVRGYCTRFDEYFDDLKQLRRIAEDRVSKHGVGRVPMFLFGHSFGGLVAASSVIESAVGWDGLVLSGPFFGLALEVPFLKASAGKVASRLMPKLALPTGLFGRDMTHDEQRAKAYDEDPLVFKKATARWFTESMQAQERAFARAQALTLPLYMIVGSADKVASVPASKRFFEAVGSTNKTLNVRDGLFHEVLNEPSWKESVDTIAAWILGLSCDPPSENRSSE